MLQLRNRIFKLALIHLLTFLVTSVLAQNRYKHIPLPYKLRSIYQEFSGMAQLGGRVYLLPQYGNHKETALEGDFEIYSFKDDSISRVIAGTDTVLTAFKTTKVIGLNKLPSTIKQLYEGFETLTFVANNVYMALETVDTAASCFLLRGTIDTTRNEILIDYKNYVTLKRPFFISNAGFESITWLPRQNKLIAFYEFNANIEGNFAYLIDTSFTVQPERTKTPFLYFRNDDAATAPDGSIYAINYYWNGDYDKYLDNELVQDAEKDITRTIPQLKKSIHQNPDYLTSNTFARIIRLKNYKKKKWKEVAVFDGFRNNWEGITLFKKGALIVSDANRSTKQVTQLAYVEF